MFPETKSRENKSKFENCKMKLTSEVRDHPQPSETWPEISLWMHWGGTTREKGCKANSEISNFAQLMNCNFTIIGSRLYLPNLKDVTGLEDAQLSFYFQYKCLYFSRELRLPGRQIYRQIYGKLEKWTERLLVKLHPSSLVHTIFHVPSNLTLPVPSYVKFNFWKVICHCILIQTL